MTIYSVFDPEFKPYGKVVPGCDTAELCRTLEAVTPLPVNRRRLEDSRSPERRQSSGIPPSRLRRATSL